MYAALIISKHSVPAFVVGTVSKHVFAELPFSAVPTFDDHTLIELEVDLAAGAARGSRVGHRPISQPEIHLPAFRISATCAGVGSRKCGRRNGTKSCDHESEQNTSQPGKISHKHFLRHDQNSFGRWRPFHLLQLCRAKTERAICEFDFRIRKTCFPKAAWERLRIDDHHGVEPVKQHHAQACPAVGTHERASWSKDAKRFGNDPILHFRRRHVVQHRETKYSAE